MKSTFILLHNFQPRRNTGEIPNRLIPTKLLGRYTRIIIQDHTVMCITLIVISIYCRCMQSITPIKLTRATCIIIVCSTGRNTGRVHNSTNQPGQTIYSPQKFRFTNVFIHPISPTIFTLSQDTTNSTVRSIHSSCKITISDQRINIGSFLLKILSVILIAANTSDTAFPLVLEVTSAFT